MRGELAKLKGKKVLEAGSGAGRFTEVLLNHGAVVHSFDYSTAVEANSKNNGKSENLVLVQADIRRMPFPRTYYDYVVCLGVLQHTPNTEVSIECLWQMVKPGGVLVVDHYPWNWRKFAFLVVGIARPIFRQYLLRRPRNARFQIVNDVTDFWFPIHWKFRDSKLLQRILHFVSPMNFHYPGIKLSSWEAYYEWALLDTHDSTTDVYRRYRTLASIRRSLEKLGAVDVQVSSGGNGVEAFCRKHLNV